MELVLDMDSLEDPSSTAIPFATLPKLSGGIGTRHKEKTSEG